MSPKNAIEHVGVSDEKQKSILGTNLRRPIITPAEARKILGSGYKELSDDELYRVIIEMEKLALLLVNNPKIFNSIEGGEGND